MDTATVAICISIISVLVVIYIHAETKKGIAHSRRIELINEISNITVLSSQNACRYLDLVKKYNENEQEKEKLVGKRFTKLRDLLEKSEAAHKNVRLYMQELRNQKIKEKRIDEIELIITGQMLAANAVNQLIDQVEQLDLDAFWSQVEKNRAEKAKSK